MGVSWVFEYPLSDAAKQATSTLEQIEQHLVSMGGRKLGTFKVDASLYTPDQKSGLSRPLYLCHHSEYPASSFTVVQCLQPTDMDVYATSDQQFDILLAKMAPVFHTKSNTKFESNGHEFQLQDFMVRPGAVTVGGSLRGISVEVEYTPCQCASQCDQLMLEFCRSLLGHVASSRPAVIQRAPPARQYFTCETLRQYVDVFTRLREAVGGDGSTGSETPRAPSVVAEPAAAATQRTLIQQGPGPQTRVINPYPGQTPDDSHSSQTAAVRR